MRILRDYRDYTTPQTDPDAVARFADRLAELEPSDWVAAADAAAHDAPARSTASATLEALIAHHGLGVQAWDALDDVQTVTYCRPGPDWFFTPSRQTATRLRVARNAANAAALALLVRSLLSADAFELLYQPFAALIPV